MRILVVGSGGREHALCWALAKEAEVICAPGNPGIAEDVECVAVATTDTDGLLAIARDRTVDLVVVGPEDPLIAGLGDALRSAGFPTFGPGAGGARLEGSKAFSKDLMVAAGIPTARHASFEEPEPAKAFAAALADRGKGVVVKASGNALGKGVTVCDTLKEADEAIDWMLSGQAFGAAGSTVVVEERLSGFEFSLLTLVSDGEFWSLPVAQDHKRAYDGDEGPNTGGMGSFSPVAKVTPSLVAETEERVVRPALAELRRRGISYRGVLFSGLMVDGNEVRCLEYNVRFGDPETQSVMARLGGGLANALYACALGSDIPPVELLDSAAVTVVIASAGYPDSPKKGFPIGLPAAPPGIKVFHAGTALKDGALVNSGGRVFGITGIASSLAEAREKAKAYAATVAFEGAWFRTDIATR